MKHIYIYTYLFWGPKLQVYLKINMLLKTPVIRSSPIHIRALQRGLMFSKLVWPYQLIASSIITSAFTLSASFYI